MPTPWILVAPSVNCAGAAVATFLSCGQSFKSAVWISVWGVSS